MSSNDPRLRHWARLLSTFLEDDSEPFEPGQLANIINGIGKFAYHQREDFVIALAKECLDREFGSASAFFKCYQWICEA